MIPTQIKTAPQSRQAKGARAAQDFLTVSTIRDGVIVLRGGGLRSILMASSLNFALKSAEEQEAIIFQYQNFLNSLDFSVQFVIQSRKLNIVPYLESLKTRSREETNELLKIQIDEYIEFIRSFVELSNIVSKTFYVVVPFDPVAISIQNVIGGAGAVAEKVLSLFQKKETKETGEAEDLFQEHKNQLQQRVEQVSLGLVRLGVRTVELNTEEIIELLYGLYNQGETEKKEFATE